jgi:hypothetical protein
VRCLACHGIISGYPCGQRVTEPCDQENQPYFRPGESVTRGQIAKIISNAAGFDEDPGSQIYADVPSSNTFYVWVQRLTLRGVISGYACGGQGEPCDERYRSYFRPGEPATRAQVSKIVSNAANFQEDPGPQVFEDVPPTHHFYDWIQRLAHRGIITGYPCGGEGEPCGPDRRPYFRSIKEVTRGQSTKIVSNTFFPACNPIIR